MCGIAGVIDRRGRALGASFDQVATLRHRGPDAIGHFDGTNASIGQSRLAIIDLVTGDPPVTNEDGTVGVALNGEIYNFQVLRRHLAAGGHRLRTEGDTEVIAHMAEDYPPVPLARQLDGMFAFAVWDESRRRLILGRDRFGKKPLYYWSDGQRLVFGSEIKAVLADPLVPRRLDPQAIPAYLTFGYVPTPATFFEGISSLPPGHVLTFGMEGTVVVEPYWQPPVPGIDDCHTVTGTADEQRHEVRRLLDAAVCRRLTADVPVGAFLSGGIDSSAVVALMARQRDSPIATFTIGFDDDNGFDERPYAALVARRFKTDHTEFVVKPDKAELIERLVHHHDQPFGDSSALPQFLLAQLTRQHVTVALSGDGGDELFGGYERFAAALFGQRLARLPPPVTAAVSQLARRVPASSRAGRSGKALRLLEVAGMTLPDFYRSWMSYVPPAWAHQLLPRASTWEEVDYQKIWQRSDGASTLDRLLNLNIRTYLLDDLLPKVDRTSMAHGLEVRSPFLDTALAEYALRLPPGSKVRGLSLKRTLKAAVEDLLPPEILHRSKRGFGVPLDRWFRTDLRSYVEALLCVGKPHVYQHLDMGTIRSMVVEHLGGGANLGQALWSLVTLEVFLQHENW
jgi:asparagine synthase (glutamine-hydrolysing)